MKRIHILTQGFHTPNGRAFLFPLIQYRRALKRLGLDIHFFYSQTESLLDCDYLWVESKYYGPKVSQSPDVFLPRLEEMKKKVPLLFFDLSDSSTWFLAEVLPHVDLYLKGMLPKDRQAFCEPIYGYRLFADFYHRTEGVSDAEPAWTKAVQDPALLAKFQISWNSGLADYSVMGPNRMAAYYRAPVSKLLRWPSAAGDPGGSRQGISCRIGTRYHRESVAFQRKALTQHLAKRLRTDKLSRRAYFAELKSAQAVLSPFGWGEISLRDFEIFLAGSAVIKPDMSLIETWPNWFVENETYFPHRWDLTDVETVIDLALADTALSKKIASNAQERYLSFLGTEFGLQAFSTHVLNLLKQADHARARKARPRLRIPAVVNAHC